MCGGVKRYMIDVSGLSEIIVSCDDSVHASFMRRSRRPFAGAHVEHAEECVVHFREVSLYTVKWR